MTIYEQMLLRYDEQNRMAHYEVIQQIALAGLYRAGFFNRAAFYGGTCLRIFHHLPRFSEDMDFSLLRKENFDFEQLFPAVKKEFELAGRRILNFKFKVGTMIRGIRHCYLIVQEIKKGCYGVLYLTSIKKELCFWPDQKVVIKKFTMQNQAYRTAFIQNNKDMMRLKHPNIIPIIDCFEKDGDLFSVTKFVEGGSLDDLIQKKGRLGEDECRLISTSICNAVDFLHSNGIVHLDIKPQNILLDDCNPVLIDFDLSKRLSNCCTFDANYAVRTGTPSYAPIEQTDIVHCCGPTVTMDIYAIGATMFKMLTGEAPPEASEIRDFGFPLNDFNGLGISGKIINIVRKCMATEPEKRFRTIKEFVDFLK